MRIVTIKETRVKIREYDIFHNNTLINVKNYIDTETDKIVDTTYLYVNSGEFLTIDDSALVEEIDKFINQYDTLHSLNI